jgi:hypothetical protein
VQVHKTTTKAFNFTLPSIAVSTVVVVVIIMALQPFVGHWLFFHFLDPTHSR